MILVTGANGRTGRTVLEMLHRRGVSVRAMVRDAAKATGLAGTEIVVADLSKPHTLPSVLGGIDSAYLTSAPDPAAGDAAWELHPRSGASGRALHRPSLRPRSRRQFADQDRAVACRLTTRAGGVRGGVDASSTGLQYAEFPALRIIDFDPTARPLPRCATVPSAWWTHAMSRR
jgi:NAD(P)H-binding